METIFYFNEWLLIRLTIDFFLIILHCLYHKRSKGLFLIGLLDLKMLNVDLGRIVNVSVIFSNIFSRTFVGYTINENIFYKP